MGRPKKEVVPIEDEKLSFLRRSLSLIGRSTTWTEILEFSRKSAFLFPDHSPDDLDDLKERLVHHGIRPQEVKPWPIYRLDLPGRGRKGRARVVGAVKNVAMPGEEGLPPSWDIKFQEVPKTLDPNKIGHFFEEHDLLSWTWERVPLDEAKDLFLKNLVRRRYVDYTGLRPGPPVSERLRDWHFYGWLNHKASTMTPLPMFAEAFSGSSRISQRMWEGREEVGIKDIARLDLPDVLHGLRNRKALGDMDMAVDFLEASYSDTMPLFVADEVHYAPVCASNSGNSIASHLRGPWNNGLGVSEAAAEFNGFMVKIKELIEAKDLRFGPLGHYWSIENPRGLFDAHPVVQALVRDHGGIKVHIRYCGFGAKLRKWTTILTNNWILAEVLRRSQGYCRFCATGKPHPKKAMGEDADFSAKCPWRLADAFVLARKLRLMMLQ